MRLRGEVGAVGFEHDPLQGEATHGLAQRLALLERERPADSQEQAQLQHGARLVGRPQETVEHPAHAGELRHDGDRVRAGVAVVDRDGQAQFQRQAQLTTEDVVLHRTGMGFPVVIQADLANGHHAPGFGQRADAFLESGVGRAGRLGVDPDRAPSSMFLGHGHHRRRRIQRRAHEHDANAGGTGAREHLIPVRLEALAVEVGVGVDQRKTRRVVGGGAGTFQGLGCGHGRLHIWGEPSVSRRPVGRNAPLPLTSTQNPPTMPPSRAPRWRNGRREGLKILWRGTSVRVRLPPSAPSARGAARAAPLASFSAFLSR